MANVKDIEGIGPSYAEKLMAAGIHTEEQLLTQGATKKHREELAEKTGIGEHHLYGWIKMCDMNRVKGIGPQTSEVLLHCGVDSVAELAQRNAEHLHAKMVEINDSGKHHLSGHLPSVDQLHKLIEEAKALPKVIHS